MTEETTKKIHSILIIEIMGTPKEYLKESLEKILQGITQEKGVKVVESKINEAVEVKDKKDFFTSFMEVEVETIDSFTLAVLMFKYMPAHIEVLYPENLILTNHSFNEILNELVRRLHGYDNLARIFQYEKAKMSEEIEKLREKKK
jgi:hypothetical protein